jgi:hypothetical protein
MTDEPYTVPVLFDQDPFGDLKQVTPLTQEQIREILEKRRSGDDPKKKRYLEPTWSVLDSEPGMDDLAEGASEILKKMGEDLKIFPFQADGSDRLFLARFEFPKFGEDFQISKSDWRALGEEAPPAREDDKPTGFIHFLAGFPIDCVEILVGIGEYSSTVDKVKVFEGKGKVVPPIPKEEFFKWPENDRIFLNLTAIAANVAKILAKNLPGEPKPEKAHWWFRVELDAGSEESPKKWPVPGEFLGLGVRMFPGMFWGHQKSSPFVYSGNWMDTVYYTGARITEVIEPTDDVPYPTYKVKWRDKDEEITVNPTDFAEYKVDDRVTILKDVATEKKTQLWKDDDMKEFGDNWMLAPICFYGLETPEGG